MVSSDTESGELCTQRFAVRVVSNREPYAAGRNESLCKEVLIYKDTWMTPKAHDDLEAHMSDVQKLQRMLLKPENYGDVHPLLMHARRSLRQCVRQAPAQSRIPDQACKTCSSLRKCERRKSNALKTSSCL